MSTARKRKARLYVIKSDRRGQYYCGGSMWSGFFAEAARWTNLRAASKVVNKMIDHAHVVVVVLAPGTPPENGK